MSAKFSGKEIEEEKAFLCYKRREPLPLLAFEKSLVVNSGFLVFLSYPPSHRLGTYVCGG